MSTWPITAPLDTAMDARAEIRGLAEDLLPPEVLAEAEATAELLTHRSRKRLAIAYLTRAIEPYARETSRPLFYLAIEFRGLPYRTRNVVRYSGDYVDMLVKELAFERIGARGRRSSLGRNAAELVNREPSLQPLPGLLVRFSDFLYTPGKHDFGIPAGRAHRFTSREAVLCVYIAMALGARVLKVSRQARAAARADDWYSMEDTHWGSASRVHYEGSGD